MRDPEENSSEKESGVETGTEKQWGETMGTFYFSR
jgi:hypothetical protein